MPITSVTVDPQNPETWPEGRCNAALLDATTEADIAVQQAHDDMEARTSAAGYLRRVRKRLGLTQRELSQRIDVPLDTIRNWEQGKREPAGPAKALLKILDKSPEIALSLLTTQNHNEIFDE
ncbi:MAG: helix-turn-helix domain-containing protein [Desulfovibrio sp.]|jgi:putative transcriptional regulator|nr:helix-turn-helix domain-containing protein [Desulfovibrio sp.]